MYQKRSTLWLCRKAHFNLGALIVCGCMRALITFSLIILVFAVALHTMLYVSYFVDHYHLILSLRLSRDYNVYVQMFVFYDVLPMVVGLAIFIIGQIRQWNKHIGETQKYTVFLIGVFFIFWNFLLPNYASSSISKCLSIADGYGLTSTELSNLQNALTQWYTMYWLTCFLWMCAGALLTTTSVYQLFVPEITVNALDETEKIELL